jgi:hypothetical protein
MLSNASYNVMPSSAWYVDIYHSSIANITTITTICRKIFRKRLDEFCFFPSSRCCTV